MTKTARITRLAAAAILVLPTGYALAGLAGGAIPSNSAWQEPRRGVRIFVETNGIHVGLVLPKRAAGIDWGGWAPAHDLADPRYAGHDHLAIGWGEQAFFLETPTWAALRPATVAAAALGSTRTLLHVEHVAEPQPGDTSVRAIVLRPDEYRRLATFIRAGAATERRTYAGYSRHDVFYTGRGSYSAVRTCNSWTGDALRAAGVRGGRWTPFPVTVMWWY